MFTGSETAQAALDWLRESDCKESTAGVSTSKVH
jgi:hypothetical protein